MINSGKFPPIHLHRQPEIENSAKETSNLKKEIKAEQGVTRGFGKYEYQMLTTLLKQQRAGEKNKWDIYTERNPHIQEF